MRVRPRGEGWRKYLGAAKLVAGMLLESLRGNKVGRLNRRLQDGTILNAWMDGTLPIVEIIPPAQAGGCETFVPDIVGLATAITDPDEHAPHEPADPAHLPVTQHTAIVGWTAPRPAPEGYFETLLGEQAIARWPSDGFRPPAAEGAPRYIYDRVVDSCGESHELHKDLVYGNFDWTNGRDTLTCWSGHAVPFVGGTGYVSEQRYGVPGSGRDIHLRGRTLYSVPDGRKVNGIALREVDGVMYLMVVWRAVDAFDGGLQKVPITWRADEPHPEAGEAEDVCEFQQRTLAMWCFNESGTEARRIAPKMDGATCEQVLTDEGIEYLPSDDLVDDSSSVTGTAQVRNAWLPFTFNFYQHEPEEGEVFPVATPASEFELFELYWDYGRIVNAGGSGRKTEKIAVDYIGDEPEYLLIVTEGGSLSMSDVPSTALDNIAFTDEWTSTYAGPYACPSVVPITATYTYEQHKTATATRVLDKSYTTPTVSFGSTSYGVIAGTTVNGTLSRTSTSLVRSHEQQTLVLDQDVITDVSCFESGVTTGSQLTQRSEYRLEQSSESTTETRTNASTLLYVDLRHGIFVVHQTDTVSNHTSTSTTTIAVEHGVTEPDPEWRDYTDESSSTVTTEASGTEMVRVFHKGIEVYVAESTQTPTSASSSSNSTPAGLDPDDHITINQARANRVILDRWAQSFLVAIEAVPPDAYDYGGSPGSPDVDEWYEHSPYAVYATSEFGGGGGPYLEQPPAYGWYYPLSLSTTIGFRQPVVYQPDDPGAEPEDQTFALKKPLHSVHFSVVADEDELFLSMPLPINGQHEEWVVKNLLPQWVFDKTLAPEGYRFYPMTFISPAFISVPEPE